MTTLLTAPLRVPRLPLRALARPDALFPAAAGFFWLVERIRYYPASFFWPPDPPLLLLQLATFLVFAAMAAAIALALLSVVRFLASSTLFPEPEPGPVRPAAWGFLAAVTAVAAALRFFWIDLIPSAPWTDVIYAIEAATRPGRFLAPWEFTWVFPRDLHPGSHVTIYGAYVDYVRAILCLVNDRITAYALVPGLPATLLPAALYLAARRLAGGAVPAAAALLAAASCWPLVLARWGWEQQLMSLLLLLGLERLLHAVTGTAGGAPSFALAGFLGGLACHTYLGGYLGLAAFLTTAAFASIRRREAGPLGWSVAGAGAAFALLVPMYLRHPELLGGRAGEIMIHGSLAGTLRRVAVSTYEYLGMFYFSLDPHYWHGLHREPHFTFLTVAFLTAGLAWLFGRRAGLRTEWLAFWTLVAATLAGGVLSEPVLAPNGYRTGFAGLLMLVPVAAGIVAVTRSLFWSPAFRRVGLLLALALLLSFDLNRFLTWGVRDGNHPSSGRTEALAGQFIDIVHRTGNRVVVSPDVIHRVEYSAYSVAFQVDRDQPLRPLHPPEVRRIETSRLAGETAVDWYVTTAPVPGFYSLQIGVPVQAPLYAINLRRGRAAP